MRPRSMLSVPTLPAVLAALAVVLGVLSMHGVAAGDHTSLAAAHASSGSLSATVSAHTDPVRDGLLGLHGNLVGGSGDMLQPADRVMAAVLAPVLPDRKAAAVAAVCVAVLLSVLYFVRRSVGPPWALPRLRRGPTRRVPPCGRAAPARPPDLLAVLCVMRR